MRFGLGLGNGLGLRNQLAFGKSYTPMAKAIFNTMAALGETPNTLVKTAYNNAIVSLTANNLLNCDLIHSYRAHGPLSSFINWKTGLVQGSKQKTTLDYPVFTINSGWETDGATNFLSTGLNLSTAVHYTQNDAGIIYKTLNTLGSTGYAYGAYQSSSARTYLLKANIGTNMGVSINGTGSNIASIDGSTTLKDGYYGVSRKSATLFDAMKNTGIQADITGASSLRVNKDFTVGKCNGLTSFSLEKPELLIIGASFTQAQFLKVQEIFNKFFYELDIALAEDVTLHGAVGDGITDDYTAITAALSTYNSIKIGSSRDATFLLSRELVIPTNRTVVIDGTVKTKNGTTTQILQNLAIGGTQIYVASTVGFNVGELVGWTDDLQAIQGGGIQTRRVGGCAYITIIDSINNIITVNFGSKYAITAASNAILGHYQNVLKVDAASKNIHIFGDGKIDGNLSTQLDIDGVYNDAVGIEYGGSALFVKQCNGITIKGRNRLEFTNSILHGVAFLGGTLFQSKNIVIDKVKCHLNHDKNLILYNTNLSSISNYIGDGSLFEDGLIYYAINTNATFNNVSCSNNRRGGLYANNNTNLGLVGSNISLYGNMFYDIVVASTNVALSNVTITGNPAINQRYSVWVTSIYSGGVNVAITNMTINDIATPTYGVIGLSGLISAVAFNETVIDNCNGVGIIATDGGLGGFPQNIDFVGGGIYNHTGTRTSIAAGSDVVFTDFDGLT